MFYLVRYVRKLNGTNLEVKGKTPVIITTNSGKFVFTHPTISALEGNSLTISGGNWLNITFELGDIKKVEVEQYSWGKTMLFYTALAVALCIPMFIWTQNELNDIENEEYK